MRRNTIEKSGLRHLPMQALQRILLATCLAWTVGVLLIGVLAADTASAKAQSRPAGVAKMILTANAALAVGFIIGVLFGVPMTTSRPEGSAKSEAESTAIRYRPNDQLQQVSDWLVKILLGAGLTQLGNVTTIGAYLEPFIGSSVGAMVIVVYFAVIGFMSGYMTMILYLGPLIKESGLGLASEIRQEMKEIGNKLSLEGFLYQSLYVGMPDGFSQAIQRGEKYLRDNPLGSADIFGHLACAYGQKYEWELKRGSLPSSDDMKKILTMAVDYAKKAVRLDPEWKTILKNLYDAGAGVVDNDWAVFKKPENDPEGIVAKFLQDLT